MYKTVNNLSEADKHIFEIAKATTMLEKIEASMNAEILSVKGRYEPQLKELSHHIADMESDLLLFVKSIKKEFKEKRSVELSFGRIGIRSGKLSLKLAAKKYNWDWVKEKFEGLFGLKYIRVESTLLKNRILEDADKGILTPEQLEQCGIKTSRSENLYYEINWDKIRAENGKN